MVDARLQQQLQQVLAIEVVKMSLILLLEAVVVQSVDYIAGCKGYFEDILNNLLEDLILGDDKTIAALSDALEN